jgi:hypothetical protein
MNAEQLYETVEVTYDTRKCKSGINQKVTLYITTAIVRLTIIGELGTTLPVASSRTALTRPLSFPTANIEFPYQSYPATQY